MTDADERGDESVPPVADRADDVAERAAVARRAAEAGAAVAHESFRSDIAVETKGEDDVVTEADRAAQRAVIASIRESYPDDAVVGGSCPSPAEANAVAERVLDDWAYTDGGE